jgi:AraC-like DNA-binding protein
MIGVYFTPGSALLHVSPLELTDRIVSLEQIWGSNSRCLAEDIAELTEAARVERLEAALLERLRYTPIVHSSIDVVGIARWIWTDPTSMTVCRLAHAVGVSRQHLTRVFRQVVGVSPKRYCRLARFRAALIYAGAGANVQWAQVAAELGYADQSHMIAEFRELSSLTPEMLGTQQWFHPFILEARSRLCKSFPRA